MLTTKEVSAAWIDPLTSALGRGSEQPPSARLDGCDDDPLDIDILDIWRQDEGVDDDEHFNEDADEIAFLERYDDDEALDE